MYEVSSARKRRLIPRVIGQRITKPKSMRAVMQYNLARFNHYIWGDPAAKLDRTGAAEEGNEGREEGEREPGEIERRLG
jgi:hypothetical protein